MPKTIYGNPDEYRAATEVPRDTEDIDAVDVERPVQDLLNNNAYLYRQNQQLQASIDNLRQQLAGFGLLTSMTSLVLEPGRSYAFASGLRVNRFGGFAAAVTVTGVNLPAGVTVTVNPNPIAGDTADITVTASETAVAGQYDLLLRGEGGGKAVEVRVPVTVAAQSLPAAFTVSGTQTAAIDRTQVPATATVALNIERQGGFNSQITFDVAQLPAGMTVTWSNPTVSGNLAVQRGATVATISALATVPAGQYTVVLRATGGGVVRTWSVSVSVNAAAAIGPDFSLRLVYDPGDPYKVNGATLYIDRANGYAGPVYLTARQILSAIGNVLDWWVGSWPVVLINGQRGTVRVDGNAARITADGLSVGWDSGGVAPAPTGVEFLATQWGQTNVVGSKVADYPIGGSELRYVTVSLRRGNRFWRDFIPEVM